MTKVQPPDKALASRRTPIAIFLDFAAAYDTPSYATVVKGLQERGFPPAWIDLLASFLRSGSSASVVVNGLETEVFEKRKGLLQGAAASPAVFNSFIDPLVEALNDAVSAFGLNARPEPVNVNAH
jgi:hypothetical protein